MGNGTGHLTTGPTRSPPRHALRACPTRSHTQRAWQQQSRCIKVRDVVWGPPGWVASGRVLPVVPRRLYCVEYYVSADILHRCALRVVLSILELNLSTSSKRKRACVLGITRITHWQSPFVNLKAPLACLKRQGLSSPL